LYKESITEKKKSDEGKYQSAMILAKMGNRKKEKWYSVNETLGHKELMVQDVLNHETPRGKMRKGGRKDGGEKGQVQMESNWSAANKIHAP